LGNKDQSNPVKGISRYDSDEKRMHGWQARVQWDGDFAYKRFSDGVYGGSDEALEAAIEWRDEKEEELGKPRTEKWIRASGVSNGIEWHNPDRDMDEGD
jgi:hypothetical protein